MKRAPVTFEGKIRYSAAVECLAPRLVGHPDNSAVLVALRDAWSATEYAQTAVDNFGANVGDLDHDSVRLYARQAATYGLNALSLGRHCRTRRTS